MLLKDIAQIRKEYEALNVSDDFMFRHCMRQKDILLPILGELWERKIEDLVEIIHNAHIQPILERPSIHCDIYAKDSKGDIYIVEMQQYKQKEILQRSEYYNALSILEETGKKKGNKRYGNVPNCYIVFLCCFDITSVYPELDFPEFAYIPGVVYGEKNKRFINITRYTDIPNKRLQELFKFILHSDIHLHASWYVIELLQKVVARMKGDRDMMMFYMSSQAEREDWFEQGMDIGEERGRIFSVKRMLEDNMSVETIAKYVGLTVPEVEAIAHTVSIE